MAVRLSAGGPVPVAAVRDPDEEGIQVRISANGVGDGIVILAPLSASKQGLLDAARWAVETVKRFAAEKDEAREAMTEMRGHADVWELHARLRSWRAAVDALVDPEGARDRGVKVGRQWRCLTREEYVLALRARAWAITRRRSRGGAERQGDPLEDLHWQQLARWAKAFRFATELDVEPLEL